jgi:putative two-component system response regulator
VKILIAEDERITRRTLQRQLDAWGHEVVAVEDGQAAWERYRDGGFDIVVSDWDMPRMSGVELVALVRGAANAGYVYLIMLTARSETDDLVRGMEAGADDFLAKPFKRDELRVRMQAGERIIRLERSLAELNRDLERKVAERSVELLRSRDAVVFGLAKLTESRDDDTGQHLERICAYTEVLARNLVGGRSDVDDTWAEMVIRTAALHDIGKVATPDAVLLKQGPLTDEERRIIQRHPCLGGDTLLAIKRTWGENPFLTVAAEIALCHHEKWDGTGYPYGLAGENIPLSARVVALADVYDALTSKRVYKPPMPHEKAVSIIREGSGTHFDPDVVSVFVAVEPNFREIAEQMR